MKVVQTTLKNSEYRLLKILAKEKKKTIKELLREAVQMLLENEGINPNDPIFTEPPLVAKGKESESTSETHDKVLYGE